MKLFKKSGRVCMQNIRKWSGSYKVWIIAIIVLLLTREFSKDILSFSRSVGVKVTPWILPFIYNQKYIKILFFLPLVLFFSDAPFIDDNQTYVIARSGRVAWSLGQISYICLSTALYFLLIFIGTIIFGLGNMEFSFEWGKVFSTLANTNAGVQFGVRATVSSRTLLYFTPLEATFFTFVLSWLVGVFLGMVTYLLNSITNSRLFGVLFSSLFVVFDASIAGVDNIIKFSPVSWCTLDFIDIANQTKLPSITYIYISLAVILTVLLTSSVLVNRKQAIHALPPV